jgi:hypothetical protein
MKPTLDWMLRSDFTGKLDAELSYVTGGITWAADYNAVAPENANNLDITGRVTMDNQSGKTFAQAQIKLMAGEANKLRPSNEPVKIRNHKKEAANVRIVELPLFELGNNSKSDLKPIAGHI